MKGSKGIRMIMNRIGIGVVLVSLHVFPGKIFSQSLLWKISGKDMPSPSFIYGTIHLKDRRVFEWRDSVYTRMGHCKAFAGEIDLNTANLMKAAGLLLLPGDQTLQDRFSAEDYDLIRQAVKSCSGYDLTMLNKLKPVSLIALCLNENTLQGMEATVDELLYRRAVDDGKTIIGIETIEEQVALMDKIPDSYVVEFFRNLDEQREEFDKLVRCYRRADLDSMYFLMQDEESGTLLNDDLIRTRNYRMTERIIPLIRQQPTFIAIGSGHLPGNEGVLSLLRKKGYLVEPEKIVW